MSQQVTQKEIRKFVSGLLALSIFLTALGAPLARAHCEAERNQWQEFKRNCDAAVAASGAAAVGGAIAIPIFGGLLGLIPGLVGQNQCRIMNEKEQGLRACEARVAREIAEAAAREQARLSRIQEITAQFQQREAQLKQSHQERINAYINDLSAQGYDLSEPSILAEVQD